MQAADAVGNVAFHVLAVPLAEQGDAIRLAAHGAVWVDAGIDPGRIVPAIGELGVLHIERHHPWARAAAAIGLEARAGATIRAIDGGRRRWGWCGFGWRRWRRAGEQRGADGPEQAEADCGHGSPV